MNVAAILTVLLLAGPTPAEELEVADALAARARAADEQSQPEAIRKALEAYRALLQKHPKNRRLVPRIRRRRARLLERAGRPSEALREYDAIVEGRSRRKERARALYDGAVLLERGGDFLAAERRLRRIAEDYGDVTSVRGKAALARGRVLQAMARPKQAERSYRYVVERCWDDAKTAIAAYDALALMALSQDRPGRARRWLRACADRYEKRAARGDRYGAFVGRQLGAMKAPRRLAEKEAEMPP
jgi:tetratricopeptide (TPR) repeat protein